MTTLYHYCSPNAFLSIIQKKSIWLSSLTQSNDSTEGALLKSTFLNIFENDGHPEDIKNRIKVAIDAISSIIDGLGFCLSINGDLLSQWRGYATDGEGFSIGFSKSYLQQLESSLDPMAPGFNMLKVLYKPEEQKDKLLPIYNTIKQLIESTGIRNPKQSLVSLARPELFQEKLNEYYSSLATIQKKTMKVLPHLFALKHQAFSEEREFRLVSHLLKESNDDCEYHVSNNKIIPHRVFGLSKQRAKPIIKVILGPKNRTPIYVVEKLLNTNGFKGVSVLRSTATYQ